MLNLCFGERERERKVDRQYEKEIKKGERGRQKAKEMDRGRKN